MRFREIESMILEDGWYQVKQKGSHHQYKQLSLEKLQSLNMAGI